MGFVYTQMKMKTFTSRVGLSVTFTFSRLGNAVSPSVLLSWLPAKLSFLTCGNAPSFSMAVNLFKERSRSSKLGSCCSNLEGM